LELPRSLRVRHNPGYVIPACRRENVGALGDNDRVIGRISRHGYDVASVLEDVYGPGSAAGHPAPRIVAGWRPPAELEPSTQPGGQRAVRLLARLMEMPLVALGDRASRQPVWHCHLNAAPQDSALSDDEWAQVATDVMERTGLAPGGRTDDAVPWVAIRRGADSIHIVAVLARQDGGTPRLSSDGYRVQQACQAAEERYGLRPAAVRPRSLWLRERTNDPAP
jgi:hypothetical protein